MDIPVFVYGTLMGNLNGNDGEFQHPCSTVKEYYKGFQSFYPFLKETEVEDVGSEVIEGELWLINEDSFKSIDRYEGYPELFTRKMIEVEFENTKTDAWCYFLV